MNTVRVLVVDDHPVVRTGLIAMLAAEPDIEVVGEGASGMEAIELAEQLAPDVVLMDLRMPGMDGVAATKAIVASSRSPRVVVVTTYDTDSDILRAVEAGRPVTCSRTHRASRWPMRSARPPVERPCWRRRSRPS